MEDILHYIAPFLNPDPVLYFNLALVSRSFYAVFTSDRAWRFLDPYGRETNIVSHFKRICTADDLKRMRESWSRPCFSSESYNSTGHNLYLRLGAICATASCNWRPQLVVNDEQLMWCAVNLQSNTVQFANSECSSQRRFALAAVALDGLAQRTSHGVCVLQHLLCFQNDREIVLLAVQNDGRSLVHASAALKNDQSVVSHAVSNYGPSLQYASRELREDPSIVRLAVRQDGRALEFASKDLLADRKIVESAVQTFGPALQFSYFRDDREIVFCAICQNPYALEFASERLRSDQGLVMETLKSRYCNNAFIYASDELKNDLQFVYAAVRENAKVYRLLPGHQRGNSDVLNLAMSTWPEAIEYAPEYLRQEYKLAQSVLVPSQV